MGSFISNAATLEAARIAFHAAFLEQLGVSTTNPLAGLFQELPSTANLEEWDWLGDLPDFEEWKGDRFLAGLAAYKLQIRNKDWANGIRVKQNDIKDDKLGLVQPKIAGLATKAKTHRIRLTVKALIAGMGTGAFPDVSNGIAYDGVTFFSLSHATGANKHTTALSSAGLDAALLLLQSQTSFDGLEPLELGILEPGGTSKLTLIVGPKLLGTATRLATSDFLGTAVSAENNSWKNRLEVVTSGYLKGTFDDWWFLADLSQPVKPFILQLREEISTSAIVGGQGTQNDSLPRFQSGQLWFGAEARYNVAPFEFRTIVGSQVA